MNSYREIIQALDAGEKLRNVDFADDSKYVHIVDDELVSEKGLKVSWCFDKPERWEIWRAPVKQWQPGNESHCGVLYICRGKSSIVTRDRKHAIARDRLEAFVREFAPDFVPVWGETYCCLYQRAIGEWKGTWKFVTFDYNEPGTVPFPRDSILAEQACDMLNNGKLKLYDFED